MELTTRQKTLIIISVVVPIAIILIYSLALRPIPLAVIQEQGITITSYTGRCWSDADWGAAVEAYFYYDWNPTQEYLGAFSCEPELAGEWGAIEAPCEHGECVNPCKDVDCPTVCYNNNFYYNPTCSNVDYLAEKYCPECYADPYYDKINKGCLYHGVINCGACEECDDVKGCITVKPCCGNGICDTGEVYSNCPGDCKNLCEGITLTSYCASNTILRTETSCNPDNQEISYTDAKCEDNNQCTENKCVNNQCTYTPIDAIGESYCEDLIYHYNPSCNIATGKIIFQQTNCNDNNPCTTDSCSPTLECVNTPIKLVETKCDDLIYHYNPSCNSLTGEITFQQTNCDDSNACTIDSCDSTSACINEEKLLTKTKCENDIYYYGSQCNSITGEIIYYFQEPCEQGCNVTSGLCNYEMAPLLPPTLLLMIAFVTILLISGSGILIYYKRIKK